METVAESEVQSPPKESTEPRRFSTEAKIQTGFAFALIILAAVGLSSYLSIVRLQNDIHVVRATALQIEAMHDLAAGLREMEAGDLGYALTGREVFLERIRRAEQSLEESLAQLTGAGGSEVFAEKVRKNRTELTRGVALREAGDVSGARAWVEDGAGLRLYGRFYRELDAMEVAGKRTLTEWVSHTDASLARLGGVTLASVVAAIPVVVLILFFIRRDLQARREMEQAIFQAQKNLSRAHDELEIRVKERTADLSNALERLQKSERLLRMVTEDAQVGLALVDSNHRYLFANGTHSEMLSLEPRDLTGFHVKDVLPEVYEDQIKPHFERCLAGERVRYELKRVDPVTGKERYFSVTYELQRDPDGQVHVVVVFYDISERKRAEDVLREGEERLQAVIENLSEGLVIADMDGHLLHWNRASLEMHGFPPEQTTGYDMEESPNHFELSTLDGRVLPLDEWPICRILRGEVLRDVELRIRRLNSDWNAIFSYGGARVTESGGRQLAFITITDITDRWRTEEEVRRLNADLERRVAERTSQLEAANRELEAFSYSVSHDLRSPLRTLDGFSQAILEDYGELLPEEGRRYLQTIREGAQRMGALIDDLLRFSRLSRAPLNTQWVNAEELVSSVLDDLQAFGRKNVVIAVGKLPPCKGDPALLRQVWVNLISNALKYSERRDPARIEIGFGEHGGAPAYYVRDNGAGFDMRYASKLFGVFQRLHRPEEYEGTGVGLAIVQRIIQRHGGRVWAESAPEQGATFYFSLQSPSIR